MSIVTNNRINELKDRIEILEAQVKKLGLQPSPKNPTAPKKRAKKA